MIGFPSGILLRACVLLLLLGCPPLLAAPPCPEEGYYLCGGHCIRAEHQCYLQSDLESYQGWRSRTSRDTLTAPLSGERVPGEIPRMYRWRDPETGVLHYSGNPPPWYGRSTWKQGRKPPRTLVYEGMFLVDDTRLSNPSTQESRRALLEMRDKIARERQDMLEKLAREQQLLKNNIVELGMSSEMVEKIWGRPEVINTGPNQKEWFYANGSKLVFRHDQVIEIQGAPAEKVNVPAPEPKTDNNQEKQVEGESE